LRVCPKCGYEDPLCWHSYRWITDIDYATYDDFGKEYLELKDIQIGQILADLHFYYRRSGRKNKGSFVFRWPTFLGRDYYKMRDFEHYKKPMLGVTQLELHVNGSVKPLGDDYSS
jgi:hypothetical protein